MKIKEMLGTLQPGKKQEKPTQLWTKWGEEVKKECEDPNYVPLPEYPPRFPCRLPDRRRRPVILSYQKSSCHVLYSVSSMAFI